MPALKPEDKSCGFSPVVNRRWNSRIPGQQSVVSWVGKGAHLRLSLGRAQELPRLRGEVERGNTPFSYPGVKGQHVSLNFPSLDA